MKRYRLAWGGALIATAGVVFVLLFTGRPFAQNVPPGTATSPVLRLSGTDELAPRLLSGPKGEVYRLWQRWADFQRGGGAAFLAVGSPQNTWQTLVEVAPPEAGVTPVYPDAAIGASGEMVIAYQWRRNQPRAKEIRLALSHDGGKTWIHPPTPVDGVQQGFVPRPAWGQGRTLVVVWDDEGRSNRGFDVFARRSTDAGATWEPEQLLSRFPQNGPSDLHAKAQLLSDGEKNFWVVWVGLRSGRSRLYLNRSTDAGKTWTDPVMLSGESQGVFGHSLVRVGERLLLVWHDRRTGAERVFSASSADGGVTWTSPTRVDHLRDNIQTHAGASVVVMSPSGEALVAWYDGRNGRDDIFMARSTDSGRTWGTEDMRVDTDDAGTAVSRFPALATAADGRIALAWQDDRAGYDGVYLRIRGTGSAPTWGPEIVVAPAGPKKAARLPRVLWGADGALYTTWEAWDFTTGPLSPTKRVDSRVFVFDQK